jgi:WD40 repeat protein
VGFSRDSKILITAGVDRDEKSKSSSVWKAWKVPSGELIHSQRTNDYPALHLAFSPDGTSFATGSIAEVNLWKMPK